MQDPWKPYVFCTQKSYGIDDTSKRTAQDGYCIRIGIGRVAQAKENRYDKDD